MEGPISRNRASRIRDRVEGLLAEDHPECLSDLRDFKRRHPDFRSGRKQTKTQAGIDGSVENLIPVLHLRRARRGAPAPLETLRYRCWEIGFQTGIEVDARHDFECVLHRWARQRTDEEDLDEDRPEPEELARLRPSRFWKAVVRRLRPSRFWKLALGFVPIVGPVAAYRIDGALALRFHDLAAEYFHELRSSGIRPLPDDFENRLFRSRGDFGRPPPSRRLKPAQHQIVLVEIVRPDEVGTPELVRVIPVRALIRHGAGRVGGCLMPCRIIEPG